MALESIININVDFYDKKYILINAKQLDKNTRFLSVTCYNRGELFNVNSSQHIAYIRYKKADEHSVFNFCEITRDGKILIELTEQMLASSGICCADIVLVNRGQANVDAETGEIINIDNASVLSTMTFNLDVSETAVENSEIESTYEFNLLNAKLEEYWADYEEIIRAAKSYAIGNAGGFRANEDTDNAKYYYEQILDDAKEVSVNASAAATSAANAKTSEANTAKWESYAKGYMDNSYTYMERAETAAEAAELSEDAAEGFASSAQSSMTSAGSSASSASISATNAQNYYNQAVAVVNGLNGAFLPMGTITFAELIALKESGTLGTGYLYNISDNFTTDDNFKMGAGVEYDAGTNVYFTADGYFDCLAGMTVTGVKGDNETAYRKGNINLTAENVGAIATTDIATVDEVTSYLGI